MCSSSNRHAEDLGVTAGVGQGMCDMTHRILAALFPKFPESSDAGCSWNSITHTDTAIASYWPEFMVMRPPEVGLDSPSELCSCFTQPQCSTKMMRLLNGSDVHDGTMSCITDTGHITWKLQQDVKEFRNSFLVLLQSCQEEYQSCLSDVAAVVQRAELSSEALRASQSEATHLQQCLQKLESRYHLEQQRRRTLHNSLVELKGNIRVHCRIRPFVSVDEELVGPTSQNCPTPGEVVHAVDDETVLVRCALPHRPPAEKTYTFERVYGPAEPQAAVFGDVRPLLISLLDGYNVCIMAYGQTGSGKSYTMLGPHSEDDSALLSGARDDLGIIPRAAEELFRLMSENPSRSPKVDVSIVEIYNNNIFDLLAKDGSTVMSGAKCQAVTTQEGRSEGPKLTCRSVTSAMEFVGLIHRGVKLRVQHPTLVHQNSSRSHLVVTATLTTASSLGSTAPQSSQASLQKKAGAGNWWTAHPWASSPRTVPVDSADPSEQVLAKLQLVDLAGSECAAVSGVTGLALKETSFINRSLAALADVLGALSEHCDHIPYRNSKLTHLLQDSIGGDAKLLMILCVSPGQKHMAETLRGLKFGARARQVERRTPRRRPSSSQMQRTPVHVVPETEAESYCQAHCSKNQAVPPGLPIEAPSWPRGPSLEM
ncbi:kinesin-like protein KIF25 isoform X3 [Alexandromys fortis]|uniref:kinesin-like protein KIF25 isoform X3 n=1 Tax=Alexandromys fortis TaxID=100897 RepID=UPI00215249C6|nr:kinesin-like protein KIF25 isoform X3 [Microtus fortis]